MKQSICDRNLLLALLIGAGVLLGALVEIVAWLLGLYAFQPWWISLVVVFAAFGLGLGSLTFKLRSRPILAALLAGAFAFAAEIANAQWLGLWVFDRWILELIPIPLFRAGLLSLPILLAPLLVCALGSRMYEAIARWRCKPGPTP